MELNGLSGYVGYFWLSIAIILLIFELGTPGLFYFISFAIGTALAALGAFIGVDFIAQCIVCVVASIASFFLLKYYLVNDRKIVSKTKTNVDALIGLRAVIVVAVAPHHPGRVNVNGEEWVAVAENKVLTLQPNTEVIVVRVEGNKLIVK